MPAYGWCPINGQVLCLCKWTQSPRVPQLVHLQLALPSRVSHSPPSHPLSATCDATCCYGGNIADTSQTEAFRKRTSIFWDHQNTTDDHNGKCTLSSHKSSLIQFPAGLSSCLKPRVCAMSTWASTVTRWERKLEALDAPWTCYWWKDFVLGLHPLRLSDVAEGRVVLNLSHYSDLEALNIQPS